MQLRGFGMTMDLKRGTMRSWVVGGDGVKRWADTNEPVTPMLLTDGIDVSTDRISVTIDERHNTNGNRPAPEGETR